LRTILAGLPHDFSVPIEVVQHIAPGFILGFVEWLDRSIKLSVGVAWQGDKLAPGRVYLASDGFQMQVGSQGRILLTTDEAENGLRPSVSCLFRSVANSCGENAIGVLLTGMGKHGAEELTLMK
jgi:two-component system, chemotaxis family, protein-glutamate methylesterase/glutaminase